MKIGGLEVELPPSAKPVLVARYEGAAIYRLEGAQPDLAELPPKSCFHLESRYYLVVAHAVPLRRWRRLSLEEGTHEEAVLFVSTPYTALLYPGRPALYLRDPWKYYVLANVTRFEVT